MSERDPVQEAVERGAKEFGNHTGWMGDEEDRQWARAGAARVLAAALAPYGGLEAVRKLEELK